MSIERADLDAVAEQDLQELVEGQVPESLRLDYKLTTYDRVPIFQSKVDIIQLSAMEAIRFIAAQNHRITHQWGDPPC